MRAWTQGQPFALEVDGFVSIGVAGSRVLANALLARVVKETAGAHPGRSRPAKVEADDEAASGVRERTVMTTSASNQAPTSRAGLHRPADARLR